MRGHDRDIPSYPGTVGWEGQWDSGNVQWDIRDVSGMSPIIPFDFWDRTML